MAFEEDPDSILVRGKQKTIYKNVHVRQLDAYRFIGVTWNNKNKWQIRLTMSGSQRCIATVNDPKCAALLHDIALESPEPSQCFAVRGALRMEEIARRAGTDESTEPAPASVSTTSLATTTSIVTTTTPTTTSTTSTTTTTTVPPDIVAIETGFCHQDADGRCVHADSSLATIDFRISLVPPPIRVKRMSLR